MKKAKVGVWILTLTLVIAGLYFWSLRIVELKIAGVIFQVPNKNIISASALRMTSGELDNNQGAFLEFPNGPYFGKWGILLQSSADRNANGFPSPFEVLVSEGRAESVLKMTSFGWYQCDESCGRGIWYFRKVPARDDSTYSLGSVICHETEICKLFFSYRDVDVEVSLRQSQIENVSQDLQKATALVSSLARPTE